MNNSIEQFTANSIDSEPLNEITMIDQSSLAWKFFNAFIDGTELTATEIELNEYVVKDLKSDLSKLPVLFIENLPLIVVAFMNSWSGWLFKAEFKAGKFNKLHYFNRFQKYMAHKIKVLGNNQMKAVLSEYLDYKNQSNMKSSGKTGSFTPRKNNPDFSTHAISIQCPPHLLNNIVFSNIGDDVIMKQHLGNAWQDLSTAQLANWPNVEICFYSQDLCFARRQATDYVRYLNLLPHECERTDEDIIERMEFIKNCGRTRSCFTYRFLEEYIKEYILALKTLKDITGSKLEEIQTLLSQFLEDVKHINVNNSIATNTVVLFKLSQIPFIRNKKLVRNLEQEGEGGRVGYCEIITPKVELVLIHFKPQQKNTPHISFEFTDRIKNTLTANDVSLPCITYKCTFCVVEFRTGNTRKSMMDHLKNEHKMEQHVRCTACKKQFDVLNLAACRWRHKCSYPPPMVTLL